MFSRSSRTASPMRWILCAFFNLFWLRNFVVSQNCLMEIWVWDEQTRCQAKESPNAKGTLIADGECRTVQTSTSTSSSDYRFLPGSYRAVCTSDGKEIRFESSGCTDSQCSSLTVGADVCDRETTSEASLFSRLSPPEYEVKDPNSVTDPGFYSCSRVVGTGITVTFTVFGDCSTCISGGGGNDDGGNDDNRGDDDSNSNLPPPSPTVRPIRPPVLPTKPPSSPTEPPATPRPVNPETPKPVSPDTQKPAFPDTSKPVSPDTLSPTQYPSIRPVGQDLNPTGKPSTRRPTRQPSTKPSLESTLQPVETSEATTYSPSATLTIYRSQTPFSESLSPSIQARTDIIKVSMLLSGVDNTLTNYTLKAWENVTLIHIKQVASSQIVAIVAYDITQQLVNVEDDIITFFTVSPVGRDLENNEQGQSVLIMFDLKIAFYESTPLNVTAKSVFVAAFDTEADRTQYLINLVNTGYSAFATVKEMKALEEGSTSLNKTDVPKPTMNPSTSTNDFQSTPSAQGPDAMVTGDVQSSGDGNSLFLVVGALVGAVTLLVAFGLFFYRRGKKDALSAKDEKGRVSSESSISQQQPQHKHQRWTNEILVDPEVDDVSTLGGSILAGLQLVEGVHGHGEDERTASVNVDYDYVRHRYRSGTVTEDVTVDDIRSRSISDKSNPTALTSYSKLGMLRDLGSAVVADDMSFERQYDAADDDDVTNENRISDDYVNRSGSAPSSFRNFSSSGLQMSKPFQIQAPPGLLGMVIDTPGGGIPVVRAIKVSSVLCESVLVGDRLISVDHIDVTNMSAVEVSSLISTKSHLHRLLVFIRPQGEKPYKLTTTT